MTVGIGLTVWFCVFAVLSIYLNDGALRKVFFNWDVISDSWASIRKGFWLNIKMFMTAEVLVLVWALFVAILRDLPGRAAGPIRFLAVAYIDLFRALPADHRHLPRRVRRARSPTCPIVARPLRCSGCACIALTLVYGAYVAEVYRAGIESIHWSQAASARSLGPLVHRDDALRGRPPSGAPHHPAAAQRLHRPAEGHRAGRCRRRARRVQPGQDHR